MAPSRFAIITQYNSFAQNFFDRAATAGSAPPTQGWRNAINNFCNASRMDVFFYLSDLIYFGDLWDITASRLNFAQNAFNLTASVAGATQTAKLGLVYNGTAFDTSGFNPTTQVGRRGGIGTNSCISEYPNFTGTSNQSGCYDGTLGVWAALTATQLTPRLGGTSDTRVIGNGIGFAAVTRVNGAVAQIVSQYNDTQFGPTTIGGSASIPNQVILLGAVRAATVNKQTIAFFSYGADLLATDLTAVRAARVQWAIDKAAA